MPMQMDDWGQLNNCYNHTHTTTPLSYTTISPTAESYQYYKVAWWCSGLDVGLVTFASLVHVPVILDYS